MVSLVLAVALLSVTLAATEDAAVALPKASQVTKGEKHAPAGLLTSLRRQTIGEWCSQANWTSPAPMEATRFLELHDGGLLFFVQIPNYLCSSSNRAVPVVVTPKGEWKWGLPIDGLVTHLARSEDGVLWAATQWQIEGTYPALYRSKDGIAWKEVQLPQDRATSGPMEEMTTLCFGTQTLVVQIQQLDDTNPASPVAEVWSRDRRGRAAWSKESKGIDAGCQPPLGTAGRWTRDTSEEDRVLFRKDRGTQVFSLPKLLRPR